MTAEAITDRLDLFTEHRAQDSDRSFGEIPARLLDTVFVTDQLALSFIATVFGWTSPYETDRLYSPERLDEWLALVHIGPLEFPVTNGQLEYLRELRAAIHSLTRQKLAGERPDAWAIQVVNTAAELPGFSPHLDADAFTISAATKPNATHVMSSIANNAIEVLAGPWSHGLRECEGDPCTHLFVDRSPGRSRRWCTSSGCGNRARAAEFRQRRQGARRPAEAGPA